MRRNDPRLTHDQQPPALCPGPRTYAHLPLRIGSRLGIADFENSYFCAPLYHDPERAFYKALGSKPLFTLGGIGKALLNPLKLRRELKGMGERMKGKGVEGNLRGDGLTKGGILVIGPDGDVKFTFYEDPGNGVPPEEAAKIIAAAKALRPA